MTRLDRPPVILTTQLPDIPSSASSTMSLKQLRIEEEVKQETLKMRRSSNETGLKNRNVLNHIPPIFSIEDRVAQPYGPVAEYQMKVGAFMHSTRNVAREGQTVAK